jgi:hypothetical protein
MLSFNVVWLAFFRNSVAPAAVGVAAASDVPAVDAGREQAMAAAQRAAAVHTSGLEETGFIAPSLRLRHGLLSPPPLQVIA